MQHHPVAMPLSYLRTGYAANPYEAEAQPRGRGRRGEASPSGAELRLTNAGAARTVVCVNGGQGKRGAGHLERDARVARPRAGAALPRARASPRCATGSSRGSVLDLCIEDCRAAIAATGAEPDAAARVLDGRRGRDRRGRRPARRGRGRARALDPRPARRRAARAASASTSLHGSLDRWLPGIPGVSPSLSRRGFERALARSAPRAATR